VPDEQVPVLVVGGGYAGLASSLFLSEQGVRCVLVDRHPGVSIQGRARGINQRTMEIYRPLGLESAVVAAGKPFEADAGVARCQTLTGDWEWIFEPDPDPAVAAMSPATFTMADQSSVEPILIDAARTRGADLRFGTEMTSLRLDVDGVTAVLEDRSSGTSATVRAGYLIAADGHRSPIREQVGISRTGPGVTQHFISILIDADLTEIVRRRALFWIVLNEQVGFASFVTTATPGRWGVSVTYDPASQSPADFTAERCAEVARAVIGRAGLPIEVVDVATWEQAVGVADRYRAGRVFLVGDSAHVWPPAAAMGANSGVQDAHNLAWKLAAVLHGVAHDSLLDTYEAERRPVALELAQATVRRQQARFSGGQEEDADDSMWILGQRYRSAAIADTDHSVPFDGPVSARVQAGSRVPHLWLDRDGERISTHDLFHDAFVLLTGPAGQQWLDAAAELARRRAMPLRAYRIGQRGDPAELADVNGEWTRRGTAPGQAVLVRPDGYAAWLSPATPHDVRAALKDALTRILPAARSIGGRP
jgi:putative polyketide hydroxylase